MKRYTLGPPRPGAEKPRKGDLKYVAACKSKAWSIVSWRKDNPNEKRVRCFRCNSWRHPGECRLWKGAQDFVRMKEGLQKFDSWLYLVTTHDPVKWDYNMYRMWKDDGICWNRLRTRMNKTCGKSQYVCLMERHLISGQPHSNIALHNEQMLAACQVAGCTHLEVTPCKPCRGCRGTGTKKRLCKGYAELRKVLRSWATAAGYGKVIWLEPIYDRAGIAGYFQKLSDLLIGDESRRTKVDFVKEITGNAVKGEVRTQTPDHDAPKNFRRLRPSHGLLPPVLKNGDWTGEMVQKALEAVEAQLEAEGTLAKSKKPISVKP